MTHDKSMADSQPLSAVQRRIWVVEQLFPGSAAQNVALALRWNASFEAAAVENALTALVRRHGILGSRVQSVDGSPRWIDQPGTIIPLTRLDLRDLQEENRADRLRNLCEQAAEKRFDLGQAPLISATLFELSNKEQAVLLVAHRVVCDRGSLVVLLHEVSEHLREKLQASVPGQYREIVGADGPSAAEVEGWKRQLAGVPLSLDLPADRPRPPVQTFRSAQRRTRVEASLIEKVQQLASIEKCTALDVLLACFAVLLSRYARQDQFVVGTCVSGRERPENARVVGPLENLLTLPIDTSGDPSFATLLHRASEVAKQAVLQPIPFESLVNELRPDSDLSRHPIAQVTLSMQERDEGYADLLPGAKLIEIEQLAQAFDLSVELADIENEIEARFTYSTDLFDDSTISRMIGHFRNLLESAVEAPDQRISSMSWLTKSERDQVVVELNDTAADYPRDTPLHTLIEQQVEKTPDAEAVVFGSERLTYRQLNQRANQLARYLQKNGVGPDVLVGVCAERSVELVIALLASIKAGGAYVPLDPEYPADRLESMLQDADPPVVLTQAHLIGKLPKETKGILCLDRDWTKIAAESTENLSARVGGKNLAYAIYTSGSTGKPKGVPNVHEGIVNRLLWMQDMYRLTSDDRVLQKTPFSFDVSVWEFFWPLLTGAALVVARPGGHRDPAYLIDLIATEKITTLHFVPSMLSIFLEARGLDRCGSIRQVFASGEALPFELQQRFFERLDAELHNLYGPTEAAVDVTYWQCRPDYERSIVPIGRPIANTQIYILDPQLQPVPIGVPGELHIGGIGLARGYLNRPELTAEKFIADPFSKTPGARLYKTGDLARFLPDGNIEYLGRTDFQVKLRGLRIELGEIEAVLGECAGVLQAVVVVREDHPGDKRLVGYLMVSAGHEFDSESLKSELKDRLPEYMVPSRFVLVEKFPMTTSGKVNRKALPPPPMNESNGKNAIAPRNEVEAQVAALFAGVLGIPSIGVTDNFFDLGGHSLLAARLVAQLNETFGRHIPLSAMFRGATVESLARLIDEESTNAHDPIVMEIQSGESARPPFFAIVPPGEESLGYAMLARHMGPEQTVYKIQGHAPVTAGRRPYTDQEMRSLTDEYIAAMRSVQPHGPYCLGGLCDGTHIAEQAVLKLEAQGEDVGLFAIFDTWVLQHSQNRFLWKVFYYSQRLRQMRNLSFSQRLASYKRVAENKVQSLAGAKTGRTDWRETYWPEGFTPRRFRAPVVLFKRPKQPYYYINDDEMGWGERSEGGVTIHEVDFHHAEILREPHVGIFGKELAGYMTRLTCSVPMGSPLVTSAPGRHGA
jgi:amino acid adenylation domain-containing protein